MLFAEGTAYMLHTVCTQANIAQLQITIPCYLLTVAQTFITN